MGKRASLFIEIFIAVFIALFFVNLAIYFAVYRPTQEKAAEEAIEEARVFASVLAPRVLHEMESHTVQYVHQTLSSVYQKGHFKTFSLYGKKGNLIFSTDPSLKKDHLILKGVSNVLSAGRESYIFSDNRCSLAYIEPLTISGYGIYGALCIGVKDINPADVAHQKTVKYMAIASIIVLALSVIIYFVIKYILRDVAKRISTEVYRLETQDSPGHETDYRGLGYFSYVLFRISNYIKDLKEELKKRDNDINLLKSTTARQEEFLKLTYNNFIPKSFKNDKIDLEVKYMPFGGKFSDFAFIYHFDHLVYIVIGKTAVDGMESVLNINNIEGTIKECSFAKKSPREINLEITGRIKESGSNVEVLSNCAVFDLKTNRLRHFGNMVLPIILWKKSDISFMLLKPQGEFAAKGDFETTDDSSIYLANGDKIIFINQGLIEMENGPGERLGLESFMDMLSKNIESSPLNLRDIISSELNKFCDGKGPGDVFFMIAQWRCFNEEFLNNGIKVEGLTHIDS